MAVDRGNPDVAYLYSTYNPAVLRSIERVIKAGKAELIYVYIDVEPIGFNRGFYTVDMRFFYHVTLQAYLSCPVPVTVFDKRVILFGSEGSAKVFTSDARHGGEEESADRANLPTAVVEAVDPIVLNMKLVDVCECRPCDCELTELPPCVCACFGCDLCFGSDGKRIYVTLGQFSIVRLERDAQLLMPVYDYCMPENAPAAGARTIPARSSAT